MRVIDVEQVIATHRHEWGKWPDSEDRDYEPIFAQRSTWNFRQGDVELRIHNRFYPVYSAYVRSGDLTLPIQFPVINNLCPPSDAVLEQQRRDLRALAVDCSVLLWEHTHQCFPAVACDLPDLFPLLRTIAFGDDCPGSSDVKTFPVAAFFNALFHQMYVWDLSSGALVSDEYHRRGLAYTRFCPSGMSAGLQTGLTEIGYTIADKQDRIRRGVALPHLGFVGFAGGGDRALMMKGLRVAHSQQQRLGLDLQLFGINMPNGVLEPRDPPHPKGLGYPMAPLYATALSSVNMPISSLFNCRLADLFFAGVVQFVFDRWGEIARLGFVDGEHYLSFDGTSDHLIAQVQDLKAHPEKAAEMIGRAYTKAVEVWTENSWTNAFGDIYFKHCGEMVGREEIVVETKKEDPISFVAGFRR